MSTDELELLLAASLHENDSQSVDVHNGRAHARDRLAGASAPAGGEPSSGSRPPSLPSS